MNLLAKIGIWSVLVGGTATAIYAEPAGGWLSPSGTASGTASATGSVGAAAPGVNGSAQATVTATVTLAEVQPRAIQLREQSRADARHVQHLQALARKDKDVIKLNCVNDKLVQLKPQMNIADTGQVELESSTDSNRASIFEGIAQAAENIRRLREEADQCIGEPIATGGDTSNSFTGPDAPDDPTKGVGKPDLEPPGYASPYN